MLKKYFGHVKSVGVRSISKDAEEFFDIIPSMSYIDATKSMELCNLLILRDDISMQDVTLTRNTSLEKILIAGVTYLELSKRGIKGRVIGG